MECPRIEFFIIDILFFGYILHESETIIGVIYDKILAIPKTVDEHSEKK